MCGIAGIISPDLDREKKIKKMTDVIFHRGPDDHGLFLHNHVALGMRRLSIIDVASGHQPITSSDGNLTIVFNGEIYNFKKLREELKNKGYKFKTNSDTEVVLKLYEVEGENFLKKLRGMFAFCIYNKKDASLFIARDYFGIKPLYYLNYDGTFIFASEIKSILAGSNFKPKVNDKSFYKYLSFQYVPGSETIFKDIYRLMPGSYMRIDAKNGKIKKQEKYWHFSFNQKEGDQKEYSKKLLQTLEDSVSHHMISDVPVGAFLSGGVDSTAIVALMQRVSKNKISTFSIGFDEVNEFDAAQEASRYIGTDHTEIRISSKEYFKKLPELIWHFDEPVADPSAIALYFVAKEASKKVKVILSGEGADELFGGYNIYLEPFALNKLNLIPKFFRDKIIKPIANSKFKFFGKNYLKRFLKPLRERFIGNAYIFKPDEVERLWKGEDFEQPSKETEKYYDYVQSLSDSTQMQYIDINFWLPGDILAKADKMTMANSLELRVPFLDREVANFASKIPDNLKFKGGETKYLLREALKGIIPKKK